MMIARLSARPTTFQPIFRSMNRAAARSGWSMFPSGRDLVSARPQFFLVRADGLPVPARIQALAEGLEKRECRMAAARRCAAWRIASCLGACERRALGNA